MTHPRRWFFWRPGFWIPVFFLARCSFPLYPQHTWDDALSAGLGSCRTTLSGSSSASVNPAGLANLPSHSLALTQQCPVLVPEAGIFGWSLQIKQNSGGLGLEYRTTGLPGLRENDVWMAYGMPLSPAMKAGISMHFWFFNLPETFFFAPGSSLALSIRIQTGKQMILGSQLIHPLVWSALPDYVPRAPMQIRTGLSYRFFDTARILAEISFSAKESPCLCLGAEWKMNNMLDLRAGIRSDPLCFCTGCSIHLNRWIMTIAIQYREYAGTVSYNALEYAWEKSH